MLSVAISPTNSETLSFGAFLPPLIFGLLIAQRSLNWLRSFLIFTICCLLSLFILNSRHKELFHSHYGDWIDFDEIRAMSKIDDFDEAFSKKAYGFDTADDYHIGSSCLDNLERVFFHPLTL